MKRQSRKARVRTAVFFMALGVVFMAPVLAATEGNLNKADRGNSPREKEIAASVANAQQSPETVQAAAPKKALEAPQPKEVKKPMAVAEERPPEEKPSFFMVEDVRWEVFPDRVLLEIVADMKTIPFGAIDVSQENKAVSWRPEQPVVLTEKKENPVDSPLLQKVVFREDVPKTKKLGLEAPYYATEEVMLVFASPVAYDIRLEEDRLIIEFTPRIKEKKETPEPPPVLAPGAIQDVLQGLGSTAGVLGTFYGVKEAYETYVIGGGGLGEAVRKMRREKAPKGFMFDGRSGFPAEMGPVFREAFPDFGTADYWKRHVRAALRQTLGYSSDFDGTYGSWGGIAPHRGAGTWTPNVLVEYNRFIEGFSRAPEYNRPAARIDASYEMQRMFPMANQLRFGNGLRSQDINFGGIYDPTNRWALSSQNRITFFDGKTLSRKGGDIARVPRHGYRITHAGGLNYRLTKRLLWQNGIGLERTWSNIDSQKSHDIMGFMNTSLNYRISKRANADLTYGLRHLFRDSVAENQEDSPAIPGPDSVTQAKNLHSLNANFRYRILDNKNYTGAGQRLSFYGGPGLYFVSDGPTKFGGRFNIQYRLRPMDHLRFDYENEVVQDGTAKLIGEVTNRGVSTSRVKIGRMERMKLSYWRAIDPGVQGRTKFGLSGEYRRVTPLAGVYGNQTRDESGWTLQASLVRKLWRGGLGWLELTYRFSDYKSKGVQSGDTTDISQKEHAVLLIFTKYFGEWEEMT